MLEIRQAINAGDIEIARLLMRTYAASLSFDLGFQNFEQELSGLPGKYAPPDGCLLLARDGARPAGCVAVRNLGGGVCEMKRLFVQPEYRAAGVGRRLAETIIQKARDLGYTVMKLDTQASMREAVGLYRRLGFVETEAYTYNPAQDVVYLALTL